MNPYAITDEEHAANRAWTAPVRAIGPEPVSAPIVELDGVYEVEGHGFVMYGPAGNAAMAGALDRLASPPRAPSPTRPKEMSLEEWLVAELERQFPTTRPKE